MWIFGRKGASGFSACSTAEEVTQGIDGSGLTAIVTGATSGIGIETTRVLALHGVHGASTTCYVALNPKVKGVSGEYFSDNNIATNTTTSLAKDSDLAKKLWEFSLDLTNPK
ncbi:Short-chain dehydrogenase TIC 32, chloroplastic [Capsicum chinense]|nr:Short-chain dehydrogenase TIC 32, chloroplastic [Capsicum chinense]